MSFSVNSNNNVFFSFSGIALIHASSRDRCMCPSPGSSELSFAAVCNKSSSKPKKEARLSSGGVSLPSPGGTGGSSSSSSNASSCVQSSQPRYRLRMSPRIRSARSVISELIHPSPSSQSSPFSPSQKKRRTRKWFTHRASRLSPRQDAAIVLRSSAFSGIRSMNSRMPEFATYTKASKYFSMNRFGPPLRSPQS